MLALLVTQEHSDTWYTGSTSSHSCPRPHTWPTAMSCFHSLPTTSHVPASRRIHVSQGHEDGDAPHGAPAELQSLPRLASCRPRSREREAWVSFCFVFGGGVCRPQLSEADLSVPLARGSTASPQEPLGSASTRAAITSHTVSQLPPLSPCTPREPGGPAQAAQSSASMRGTAGHPRHLLRRPAFCRFAGVQQEQASLLQKHKALQGDELYLNFTKAVTYPSGKCPQNCKSQSVQFNLEAY